jgi:putative ABC transport system permease protein
MASAPTIETDAPIPDEQAAVAAIRMKSHTPLRRMHPLERFCDLLGHTVGKIRRNKLRSFLTLFGIAWGIASLVLLSALAEGFRQGQRKNMSQIGDNLVFVFGGRTEMQAGGKRAGRQVFLMESDVAVIRDQCPAVEIVAGEQKTWNVPVRSRHNAGQFLTLGVTPDYLKLRNLRLAAGRHISAADNAEGRRVAVLGHEVREQLFAEQPQVIGETIHLRGQPYTVIGLMEEKNQNSSYDGWDNDKVVAPASALTRDVPSDRHVYAEGRLRSILYRPVNLAEWGEAQTQVRAALSKIHDFQPEDESAVSMWDTVESAELTDGIFDAMEVFLSAIALVTLSLGGVGVMNTMMMAVSERTNEIGLKMALGAARRRILLDFLLEGMMLALLAGVAGLGVVLGLAALVNSLPAMPMFAGLPIRWTALAFATGALGSIAVLASLPPAYRASRMTPVEALRNER